MSNSVCEQPPFDYRGFQPTESGMDRNYAEIPINRCRNCHLEWLVYLIEDEQYPGSGRWWQVKKGSIPVDLQSAQAFVEAQNSCFIGGSYHGHAGRLFQRTIRVK